MDDKDIGSSGMPAHKPLTDAQKKAVMDLLTTYDGKQLTAEDLKSIMELLDKGGTHGPATGEARKLAGITEERFRSQLPAPSRDGGMPPPPGGQTCPPPAKK